MKYDITDWRTSYVIDSVLPSVIHKLKLVDKETGIYVRADWCIHNAFLQIKFAKSHKNSDSLKENGMFNCAIRQELSYFTSLLLHHFCTNSKSALRCGFEISGG